MARNVEIKARVADLATLETRVRAVADSGPFEIFQDDCFFQSPEGRLKLRDFGDGRGELIFYQRPDQSGPKHCHYQIVPTDQPDQLRLVLTLAWGEAGRVRKNRRLYLSGRTRIHLDRVEGLGEFVELEVVLANDESTARGQQEAEALVAELGISAADLLECAYVDMLQDGEEGQGNLGRSMRWSG
ncbi:MAG: class IV adenylate cyclase [Wenzhouxiangella sp.]|nr:class IV adenylate cyclase [Wenzhouxiangella sp.]